MMENETIIYVVVVILGFIMAVLGLTIKNPPGVTRENRAKVARGLFDYFTREE